MPRKPELASFHPKDRKAWRAWLSRHHATSSGVWLAYWRASTGKPRVGYDESIEEALCFGWIDGLARTIDAERYARKFTPRAVGSEWSAVNIARARRLEAAGLMTPAGRALARSAREGPKSRRAREKRAGPLRLPKELREALAKDPVARGNFEAFAPGYRRLYVRWITEAKRPETRAKRLREAVQLIARNVKSLMK
jgi:uncharacterized protein YdeI (YjbR/CyaY-like superfamily)